MEKQAFNLLLQQPEQLSLSHTMALEAIVKEFPYFQSARALYLKALKNTDSFKYNTVLKTTAAYTTDRSILFDFITSEIFNQNQISDTIKQNSLSIKQIEVEAEDISVITKVEPVDEDLDAQFQDAEEVLNPGLFQPKSEVDKLVYFSEKETITSDAVESNLAQENTTTGSEKRHNTEGFISNDTSKEAVQTSDEKEIEENETKEAKSKLQIGKPLEFNRSETHSFNEWLSLTHFKPVVREAKENANNESKDVEPHQQNENVALTSNSSKVTTAKKDAKEVLPLDQEKKRKFDLIDQFILKNPKIKPSQSVSIKPNLVEERSLPQDALMTETLARIYLEQKNFKKAIKAYQILSLKYPEKSGFFADQIKAIKKIQENN